MPATATRIAATATGTARKRKRARRTKASRTPIDRLLPRRVLAECLALSAQPVDIALREAAQLHERADMQRRYRVTLCRLHNYVRKICAHDGAAICARKAAPCSDAATNSATQRQDSSSGPNGDDELRSHRARQASIAEVLDATFGQFAESNPELWDRRAYLFMVGLIYERLESQKDEVPTDELVALSRILQRKPVAADSERNGTAKGEASTSAGERRRSFADAVRTVYGTAIRSPGDAAAVDSRLPHTGG